MADLDARCFKSKRLFSHNGQNLTTNSPTILDFKKWQVEPELEAMLDCNLEARRSNFLQHGTWSRPLIISPFSLNKFTISLSKVLCRRIYGSIKCRWPAKNVDFWNFRELKLSIIHPVTSICTTDRREPLLWLWSSESLGGKDLVQPSVCWFTLTK